MIDHLTPLVASSHNFGFLANASMLLAADAASAEQYVHSDPDAAMTRARRFSETLVRELINETGIGSGKRLTQNERIQALTKAGVITPPVRKLLDTIRHAGNHATHEHSGDRERATASVKACFELGVWWYRRKTGNAPRHPFVPPAPADAVTDRERLKQIGEQIEQLRITLLRSTATEDVDRPEPRIRIRAANADSPLWQGGSEINCGSTRYLVHEPVHVRSADDRSWTVMQANGHSLDSRAGQVRLGGLLTTSSSAAARRMADGFHQQALFLKTTRRRRGLPDLVDQQENGRLRVLVTARPTGSSWTETFAPGREPLDPWLVPSALDVLVATTEALAELHRQGQAHRHLTGDEILVPRKGPRGALRDIGLAWWPSLPGEGGPYQAPEQRSTVRGRPGTPTDIFQLAALLHHTCAGFRPTGGQAVALCALIPAFPRQLDDLLNRALDPDPARRPDAAAFATGLQLGRQQLLNGATA
jgi:hypothetical protein